MRSQTPMTKYNLRSVGVLLNYKYFGSEIITSSLKGNDRSSPMCQGQMWSFQKDGIKNNREKVETSWKPEFWSSLPVNLMQPFPHPNDATHKFWSRLANWLQSYSSSKVWNFCHSRANNFKMSGLIQPKIELDQAFMPLLVTSNFDDDWIKNEQASMETPFSHYKSMGNFLEAQGQLTP